MEQLLQSYRLKGDKRYNTFESLKDSPVPMSIDQQMDILSSISNDHRKPYPKKDGRISSKTTKIGLLRRLAYQQVKDMDEDVEEDSPTHLPASPRNRLIYFSVNNRQTQRHTLLQHTFVKSPLPSASNSCNSHNFDLPDSDCLPPRKTRRQTARVVKVTAQSIRDQQVCAANQSLLHTGAFCNFKLKLVEVGSLFWRCHTDTKDIFIMNEYSEHGEIVPNNFVEVCLTRDHVFCSCETYRVISSIAHQEEEHSIPTGLLCMHCRFVNDEVKPHLQSLLNDSIAASSPIQLLLKKSKAFLNDPVVKLSHLTSGTMKYSVHSLTDSSSLAIVNVSSSGIMAFCNKGMCQAASKHKRSVKRLMELEEASTLCDHLACMHANMELWTQVTPAEFEIDEVDEADVDVDVQEQHIEYHVPQV
jgi:hypothetical protein